MLVCWISLKTGKILPLTGRSASWGESRKACGVCSKNCLRDFADVKTVLQLADWVASSGKARAKDLLHWEKLMLAGIKDIKLRSFKEASG